MNKVISFLVIVFIAIINISSVNAFGTYADKTHVSINGKKLLTGKQVYIDGEFDNTLYFHVRYLTSDGKDEFKYYNYKNGELLEVEKFLKNEMSYDNIENGNLSEHYKIINEEINVTKIIDGKEFSGIQTIIKVVVDGKEYGPYNTDYIEIHKISDNAFWFNGWEGKDDHIRIFYYPKKEIKSNPKIDKILVKFFSKIDKKGESKSKVIYESLIKKIDSLVEKSKNSKTKELLNYIKDKVLEKIK